MSRLFRGRARAAVVTAGIAIAITAGAAPSAFAATAGSVPVAPSVLGSSAVAPRLGPIHGTPVQDPVDVERRLLDATTATGGGAPWRAVVGIPGTVSAPPGYRVRVQWGTGAAWTAFSTYSSPNGVIFTHVFSAGREPRFENVRINIQDPTGKVGTLTTRRVLVLQ
jgi:hypothetical protein